MKKSLPISFLLFLFIMSVKVCSQSITWTETQPAGEANKNWFTTSMSSVGSKVIAGVYPGRLYISTDGGSIWTVTNPLNVDADKYWRTTSMSSDGTKLIAGVEGGRLYISTDGGTNWTETKPLNIDADKTWYTTSMSSDGSKLIAGVGGGRLYISTDGGTNWTETKPLNIDADKTWLTTSMSSDGSKLIAGPVGRLYISTNGGTNWTETQPAGEANKSWYTTSMSSGGSKLIAGVGNGRLYISTNDGSIWTVTNPLNVDADKYWSTTSMSSDGTKLIAGVEGGRLYISTDGGTNWTETKPLNIDADKNWSTTSMSSDGSKVIAGVLGGRLYLNNEPLPVELASFTAQVNSNIVTLYWQTATEVNNYGFEVQRSVVSGQFSEWETIGFVNGHGNSNSPKDYSFIDDRVSSVGKYCYRLKQIDTDGSFEYSDIVEVDFGQPTKFELMQNYPNPFNPSTKISFTVPQDSKVRLTLFNTLGQEIAVLEEGFKEAGFYTYQLSIDNYQLQSGVYFYKLEAGSFAQVKKMIIAK